MTLHKSTHVIGWAGIIATAITVILCLMVIVRALIR